MKVLDYIKYWRLIFLVSFIVSSCSETVKQVEDRTKTTEVSDTLAGKVKYYEFQPGSIPTPILDGIEIDYAYKIDFKKIVAGYYSPTDDGELSEKDSENDWGYRLFLLNDKDEVLYQSQGVGDVYLFEPHFYKNEENNKVIIICQLAFEYCFGGDVFIFEKGKVQYIGRIDVESFNRENQDVCLTDVVVINEDNNRLTFKFDSDSLIINPGGIDEEIKFNDGFQYIFENQEFKLKK